MLGELTGRMVESKSKVTKIRQEILALEATLPELEASKKLAILGSCLSLSGVEHC